MLIPNPYDDLSLFMTRHSLIASLKLFAREDPSKEIRELVDLTELVITLSVGQRQ